MNYATAIALRVLGPRVNCGKKTHTTLQLADSAILLTEQHSELLLGLLGEHGHLQQLLRTGPAMGIGREHGLEDGSKLGVALVDFGRETGGVFPHLHEGGESVHVGFEHPGGERGGEERHEEFEQDESGGEDVRLRGVGGGLLLLGRGVGLGADAGGEGGVGGEVWW